MNNEKNGLVSVVMPAYNAASFIGKAIASVLNQTYTNLELIIVNDGCTDATAEVVQSFTDDRIRYFDLGQNRGRGYARNFAVAQCRGEFVAVCDADDINLPTRLEKQVHFLSAHPDTDVVGTQLLHFSDTTPPHRVYSFPESPEAVRRFFAKGLMGVPHASCMLRKKCLDHHRYENAIAYNVEDFELFLRLNHHHKMASLPEALVLYRNELSTVTLERIQHHELYHRYAFYSAQAKLNGTKPQDFEKWSLRYKKTWEHKRRSLLTFYKMKTKRVLRRLIPENTSIVEK